MGGAPAKNSQRSGARPQSSAQSLGWGSNIQNARLGRAAEAALKRGDHAQALAYAQRAAQAAPNDPELWFLLGYAARLDGNIALSVSAYNHGLSLKPQAADGRSGLAEDYNLMGRTADAVRLLTAVVTENPSRRDDLLFLGDLLMHSKSYDQAKQWLLKAETLRPGARSELLLAICYQNLKQLDLADRYLEMAKKRAPNNPDVERSLAGYYREVHNYSAAIAALKTIRNPPPDAVAELAYTYQLDNKPEDAAKFYLQAANSEPKDFNLQMDAAQAEVSAGSIDRAEPLLSRANALSPNSYRIHALRGDIAQLQGQQDEALSEYKAAVAGLPANPVEGALYGIQLHMNLVDLYRSLEDPDAARRELAIAQSQIASVNAGQADKEAYLRLKSVIELHAGQYEQALTDVNQALAGGQKQRDDLQLKGDILMQLGRTDEALSAYGQVLKSDPNNRYALISMGYACRAAGRDRDAEMYFRRLEKVDPTSATPYLALGDLYTARKEFAKAEQNYARGYKLNSRNAFIVAGGLNIAVESHNMPLGAVWMKRVTDQMTHEPEVLREEERYLRLDGKYEESEKFGEEAIKKLPRDRDTVVYLGYDLLNLGKYNELLALTRKYYDVLPKDRDIPLLQGYVERHDKHNQEALRDFTEVIRRDPTVVTAYVNRGYILNDLHESKEAAANFKTAIHLDPKDGDAHLGLAYADLEAKDSEGALHEADMAQRLLGDGENVHEIRATAYGDQNLLSKAEIEYRAALKFAPNNATLHFDLGNTLFGEQRYHRSIEQLQLASKLSPGHPNPSNYAMMARAYAHLQDRDNTMRYVRLAEEEAAHNPQQAKNGAPPGPPQESEILLSTGEALSTLGEEHAAMERYRRALEAAKQYRVGVRLAIAGLMAQGGHADEAQREIALAWMEVESGRSVPPNGSQLIEAADIFSSLHEYELAQSYLERAKTAGAPDTSVRIGLANNYLALGNTNQAQAELDAIKTEEDGPEDYQYLMAEAQVWSQKHENAKAMTAFAQAESAIGSNDTLDQDILQAGGDEGLRVTPNLSALSDFNVSPIFEDTSVYVLDSKLDASFPIPSYDTELLPQPRSSIQTQWTDAFHLHMGKLPAPGGFFQVRNARGQISVPAFSNVVRRNTTDTTFNFGMSPTVHLGDNIMTFSGGVQETIRRDSLDPVDMDQNLFRVYAYLSTGSLFNAVSVNGFAMRETGPFTRVNIHSRMLAGELNFRVGTPWSSTALLAGWGTNDQWYKELNAEYYYSSSYVGIAHTVSPRINFSALMQYVRAWRGVGPRWGIAQDIVPTGNVDFKPAKNWDVNLSAAYSNNRGFHIYDAVQNSVSVSYAWPFRRMFDATSGAVSLAYPIRFSAGLQEETFYNFSGPNNKQFRPYVEVRLF